MFTFLHMRDDLRNLTAGTLAALDPAFPGGVAYLANADVLDQTAAGILARRLGRIAVIAHDGAIRIQPALVGVLSLCDSAGDVAALDVPMVVPFEPTL